MKIRTLSLCGLALLAMLAGCDQAPENPFLGQWYKTDGSASLQFFDDGTIAIRADNNVSGDYRILDESSLQLDLGGMGAMAGPLVLGYEFQGESLLLEGLGGNAAATYSRDDPGPIGMIWQQVTEGLQFAGGAKAAVSEFYRDPGRWPESNSEAGLPRADAFTTSYVESVAVKNGLITVAFRGVGSNAHSEIAGATLMLEPSADGASVDWVNRSTSIDTVYLPAALSNI